MANRAFPAIEPEELLSELLKLDPGRRRMRWLQILSPARSQYEVLKPLLAESLEVVKAGLTKTKKAG
jgi:predicted DNA-binding protein (MmcQ/YjbR family)